MEYGYIYKITCKVNKKQYIGQTTQNPYYYFKQTYVYGRGKDRVKIANAIKKYGIDNFRFDVIDSATDKVTLDELEDYYISFWNTIEVGFNCKGGGSNGKHSQETCNKISLSLTGNRHSDESKSKMSVAQKGKLVTQETKKKLYQCNIGKKHSELTKSKMSVARKGKTIGMSNPNAKEVTIKNTDTNKVISGSLSQLSREYGFSRDCMRKYNKSKQWELVTSSTKGENK